MKWSIKSVSSMGRKLNFHQLPFKDIGTNLMAFLSLSNSVCINNNKKYTPSDFSKDCIEKNCEGIISHETIHGVLYKQIGFDALLQFDNIDGWFNGLEISSIIQSSQ